MSHNFELTPVEYRVLMHGLGVADSALGDLKDRESQSRLKGLIDKIAASVPAEVKAEAAAQANADADKVAEENAHIEAENAKIQAAAEKTRQEQAAAASSQQGMKPGTTAPQSNPEAHKAAAKK